MPFRYLKRNETVLLFKKKKTLTIFMNILFFSCPDIFDLELVHEMDGNNNIQTNDSDNLRY